MNRRFLRFTAALLALIFALSLALTGCDIALGTENDETPSAQNGAPSKPTADVGAQREAEKALGVPKFSGTPYAELNNNTPTFEEDEITVEAYEFYSELDSLGRCGYTEACVGKEIMPTEDRESISSVKPS